VGGSSAARRPAHRQVYMAARLDAIGASQERDQGGGKGRKAVAFSLWVGDGVIAGLTEMAVRLGEVVLTPGSGVRLRSTPVCLGVPAPTNGSRGSGSWPHPCGTPAKVKRTSKSKPPPPLLPLLLLSRPLAEDRGKKTLMGLVAWAARVSTPSCF
jgi:hypothetical protein